MKTKNATSQYFNQAIAAHKSGDLATAANLYTKVLAQDKEHAQAMHYYGLLHHQQGESDIGLTLMLKSLNYHPNNKNFLHNCGSLLMQLQMHKEARPYYEKACALTTDNAELMSNYAYCLDTAFEYDKANKLHERALELTPDDPVVCNNFAAHYLLLNESEKAIVLLENALKHGGQGTPLWNLAQAKLKCGELKTGWAYYRRRWESEIFPDRLRHIELPGWNNEALQNKSVLLWCEQGIGDEVMFAGLFAEFLALGAKQVVIECDPRLIPLYQRSFPSLIPYPKEKPTCNDIVNTHFDYQIPIGDLPDVFRKHWHDFKPHQGYLKADQNAINETKARYQQHSPNNKLIGLSWHCHNPQQEDRRSISLEQMLPLLKIPGITWVNLQYGASRTTLTDFANAHNINTITDNDIDPMHDIDNYCAQIAGLDSVISIDNSCVHMAGALGVPAHVLLPLNADWRWFNQRPNTPWYPSLTLHQQKDVSTWDNVISEIETVLKANYNKE